MPDTLDAKAHNEHKATTRWRYAKRAQIASLWGLCADFGSTYSAKSECSHHLSLASLQKVVAEKCPTSTTLWVKFARILEDEHLDRQGMQSLLECSMSKSYFQGHDHHSLYLHFTEEAHKALGFPYERAGPAVAFQVWPSESEGVAYCKLSECNCSSLAHHTIFSANVVPTLPTNSGRASCNITSGANSPASAIV